jgi:hypothetical protein
LEKDKYSILERVLEILQNSPNSMSADLSGRKGKK